jgi:hypothetical protein
MIVWLLFFLSIVVWLWAGRALTLLVDNVIPFPTRSLAVSPLTFHGSEFVVGGESLVITMLNNENADLQLVTDLQNRVVFSMGRVAFVLGPRTNPVNPNGPLIIDFVADPGDQVRLSAHESLLGWPNPFEFNWLGGSVPRWKKYVYYRLDWTKRSGAQLKMRWRYERDYYLRAARRGWTEPLMKYDFKTGLQSVEILPESRGAEGAIVRYIARTKDWNRSQYWIERQGMSKDGQAQVFAIIRLCDGCLAEPAPSGSVELYVDRAKEEVTKELGYQ